MFVYILRRIFDTCLSLYMKGYYISTTTFIVHLNITTPKKFEPSIYMLGTYLYFKYFLCVKLKRIHKSMLNNSDIKTRNSELYIILYVKVQRSPHIVYDILYYTTANFRRKTNSLLILAGCYSLT
jgi:hypothetical protein